MPKDYATSARAAASKKTLNGRAARHRGWQDSIVEVAE
ncbi:hypothetical protein J2Y58_000493 [Sphingomonas sp. BE138]|nr:hypothetical protein [Sphingomonas sp. BE138]